MERAGLIDLLFGDESGFSLEPSIPYGWLAIGEQSALPSEQKHVGNVLGLLSCFAHGQMHCTHQQINSEFVAGCPDKLSDEIKRATVIVLDNASFHRSGSIQEKIPEWKTKDLYIFYLPPYSPQLNMIEILWRKIKYEWLLPEDYASAIALKKAILNILENYGHEFNINFSEKFLLSI